MMEKLLELSQLENRARHPHSESGKGLPDSQRECPWRWERCHAVGSFLKDWMWHWVP